VLDVQQAHEQCQQELRAFQDQYDSETHSLTLLHEEALRNSTELSNQVAQLQAKIDSMADSVARAQRAVWLT
jgi:hypothetical protein